MTDPHLNTDARCTCNWCGTYRTTTWSETIFYNAPQNRTICDWCVGQNDWVLTDPLGLEMWMFCNEIKLHWVVGVV